MKALQSYKGLNVTKMQSLRGFTLVEMAIVLVLFGIVMSMGLKMVTANLDNAAFSATKSKQERIKLALIGYLRTNGKLPCPDTNLPPDGSEDRPTGTPPNDNTCTAVRQNFGVVPYVSMGLTREDVLDGWGNYFTYKVATAQDTTSGYPPLNPAPQKFRTSNLNWTLSGAATVAGGFDITSLNTNITDTIRTIIIKGTGPDTTARDISYTAVAVIVSHGKNGFGAATTKSASRMPATAAIGAGQDEISNATDTTPTSTPIIFIRRPVTEDPAAVGGAYDDLVVYMTPQDLLQPLVNEGSLKTCIAYCPFTFNPSCTSGTFRCAPISGGGIGVCSRTGLEPTCTTGSTDCRLPDGTHGGTPQCLAPIPPTTPCTASGIPIGRTTLICPT